jgi:hypothetical protein
VAGLAEVDVTALTNDPNGPGLNLTAPTGALAGVRSDGADPLPYQARQVAGCSTVQGSN